MDPLSDKKIIDSWGKNAIPWIAAVRENQIESRALITNSAIIESVRSVLVTRKLANERPMESVLDIGCGEGWLMRELSSGGLSVSGLDVISDLVTEAETAGNGKLYLLPYEEMSETTITEKFDLAICNFSLLGKESVDHVFNIVPKLLTNNGHFIVQTLHPHTVTDNHPYADGWREGSWTGFDSEFRDPAPWYFRTMETWRALFDRSAFDIVECREPINPKTGAIASLIMIGRLTKYGGND